MSKFNVGQKVTPTAKNPWRTIRGFHLPEPTNDPEFGKIYTVRSIHQSEGKYYIGLEEFPNYIRYNENRFAPVIPDSVLEKELSEIFSEEIAGVK
jgi:hypothetical protein